MLAVFDKSKPLIQLNPLLTQSEQDEQEGYRLMFSGAVQGIRNPGGHEIELSDDPDVCLDHLAFASLLPRRLAHLSQLAVAFTGIEPFLARK